MESLPLGLVWSDGAGKVRRWLDSGEVRGIQEQSTGVTAKRLDVWVNPPEPASQYK